MSILRVVVRSPCSLFVVFLNIFYCGYMGYLKIQVDSLKGDFLVNSAVLLLADKLHYKEFYWPAASYSYRGLR